MKKPDYFINADGWLVYECPQHGTALRRRPSQEEIDEYAVWLEYRRTKRQKEQSFDRAMEGV